MSKSPPHPRSLTAAQLEVMNIIWRRREATIGEVWEELRQQRKTARATVQTVIRRLEDRGWLKHRTIGQTFMYTPAFSQAAIQRRIIDSVVDTAFEGSIEGLVWALLRNRKVSPDEADRIQKMIERAKNKRGKKREKP